MILFPCRACPFLGVVAVFKSPEQNNLKETVRELIRDKEQSQLGMILVSCVEDADMENMEKKRARRWKDVRVEE